MAGPAVVTGEIVFPADAPALDTAALRVVVEDVSRADADAVDVAEAVLEVAVDPAAPPVGFTIVVAEVDDAKHYNLRAHVDADGSGTVTTGDLISVQSHPVLTFGEPSHVVVALHHLQ